ncbi:MAG: hypothetical protein WC955_03810 [Elusimicrobiota bacterium]
MKMKSIIILLMLIFFPIVGGYTMGLEESVANFLWDCMWGVRKLSSGIVSYEELGYMEYIVENSTVVIRSDIIYDQFLYVADYKFKELIKNNERKFILSYFYNKSLDGKQNSDIKSSNWGYRLDIKINNIKDNDRFYYKDKKGLHEVTKGTKESWIQYRINRIKSRVPNKLNKKDEEEFIQEMLNDVIAK